MIPKELDTRKMAPLAALLAATLMAAGCSSTTLTEAAVASETALATTHDTSDSPELAGALAHLAAGPKDEALEAWRCDPEPDITYVEVCGKQFPATLHFEWTQCALPRGPRADPRPCNGGPGGPGGPGDGGMPPGGPGGPDQGPGGEHRGPPPGGGSGGSSGQSGPGAPGADATPPSSSGKVDIAYTITTAPAGSCDEGVSFVFNEKTTFRIDRSDARRGADQVEGTTESSSSHPLEARQFTKSTTLNVSHTRTPTGGTAEKHVLSGTVSVAFDATGDAPVRTINGSLQRQDPDGSTRQETLTDVVRVSPRECRAPTSGKVVSAGSDGTTHTLVFGPTCGEATLDGVSVDLEQGRGGPGGPGGPGMGEGGPGGPLGALGLGGSSGGR